MSVQPATTTASTELAPELASRWDQVFGLFGEDDRLEPEDLVLTDPVHAAAAQVARGVCTLLDRRSAVVDTHGFSVGAGPDRMGGTYAEQPRLLVALPASGFLVSRRHLLTAAHAVTGRGAGDLLAVFGFRRGCLRINANTGEPCYRFERRQAVGVRALCFLVNLPALGDVALLELDQAVDPAVAAPLPLAPRRSLRGWAEVFLAGHPRGQPLKLSIRRAHQLSRTPRVFGFDETTIVTNVDAFRGNSGSPLLDAAGRVLGVQVRGLPDETEPGRLAIYGQNVGGSWAIRIETLRDVLVEIDVEQPPPE